MALLGLLICFLGLVVSIFSLSVTSSVGGRLAMVLAGIAISLFGIIGLVNRSYLKNALWRKSR
jgi:hypothetical protein